MLELYKNCYNLEAEPFRLSPDYRFSFGHRSYRNAKAYLEYALSQGEGFIAITGAPGTGKTTLIRDLLHGLDDANTLVATLSSAQLDLDHLITLVIRSFGVRVEGDSIALSLMGLEQFLVQRTRRGGRAILIVDEAQGLSSAALEELRLLSNLQYEDRLLLQIFLVGQDGLLEMIQRPGMEHLHQRLIAASSLEPLDLQETVAYLEYRLCQVGWQGDPAISEGAIRVIHRFSAGIPRRINLIAHRLFLYGGTRQQHALGYEDACEVIEELRGEHLLATEVSGLQFGDDGMRAEDLEGDDALLGLPRAESFALARLHSRESALPLSDALSADITPPPEEDFGRGDSGEAGVQSGRKGEDRDDGTVRGGSADETAAGAGNPVAAPAGKPLVRDQRRRTVWAAFLVLLAGLLLVVLLGKDFRERLIDFMHVVLNTVEHDIGALPAEPLEKADAPHDRDSAIRKQELPAVIAPGSVDPAA